jgi:prepilin-type N-terminal cleavage/methylation domain-containing protein
VVRTPPARRATRRSGFSLVELIVATVILSVGILSLAGTAGWVVRQVTISKLTTERAAARQTAIEGLHATQFANLAAGADTTGEFTVTWAISESAGSYTSLQLVTSGLGWRNETVSFSPGVADTITITIMSAGF